MKWDVIEGTDIGSFAYGIKGKTLIKKWNLHRGEHVSAIVAMTNTGVLYFNIVTSGVSAGTFDHFVINTLLSKLQPFHGQGRRK